jgi:hypothetical protein
MKILVSGSRSITPAQAEVVRQKILAVVATLEEGTPITIVVGDATGVDSVARKLAREQEWTLEVFVANWTQEGKKAGPLRNARMMDTKPDLVVAFPRGASPGTRDVMRKAKAKRIPMSNVEFLD